MPTHVQVMFDRFKQSAYPDEANGVPWDRISTYQLQS